MKNFWQGLNPGLLAKKATALATWLWLFDRGTITTKGFLKLLRNLVPGKLARLLRNSGFRNFHRKCKFDSISISTEICFANFRFDFFSPDFSETKQNSDSIGTNLMKTFKIGRLVRLVRLVTTITSAFLLNFYLSLHNCERHNCCQSPVYSTF